MNVSLVSTILRAFLKWWWLVAICAALGVGVGYFVRTDQPDIYMAKATVLIGQDPRFITNDNAGGITNTLLEAYSVFARRSTVLQPVIDELALGVTPDGLAQSIELFPNPRASLLEIVYYDTQPERAALIANRIALELVNQSLRSGSAAQNTQFVMEQLTNLEGQISTLQDEYNALVSESATLTSAFALNENLVERQRVEGLLQQLRSTYADLNTSLSNVQGQVTLFEEARPNYWPIASNSMMDLVIAGGVGVVLAVVTIVVITFFDNRLQWQEQEFETLEGVKVLGPLGIIPLNKLPLYAKTMVGSVEVEALRQIRDKLFLGGNERPQVITFVSYDSGDGKTLTTSNMAITFANSGLRTIALDLDLRKGDLHEIFGLPNVTGVGDLLTYNDPLEELIPQAILNTGIENLALITAGRSNTDPSSLLSRSQFPQLIYLLRQEYDVIVMDSVPTIAGTDSIFLAEVSDGVIILVSARRTTLGGFKRIVASLKTAQNVHILGVVFNRVRLQITSKYNNPYYHPSTSLRKAQQIEQEFLKPSRGGLLNLRTRVIKDRNGEILYALPVAAARLGVRERTVRKWVRSGYLRSEKRHFRRWVRESDIQVLLKHLPVQAAQSVRSEVPVSVPEQQVEYAVKAPAGPEPEYLPEQLRERRAALLDFVNKPVQGDGSNSHENHA